MIIETLRYKADGNLLRWLGTIAFIGGLVSAIGVITAPERAWPSLLLAIYYILGLGLAGSFFLAITYVSNAGWSAAIKRIPEAMAANVYVAGVLMLLVILGSHNLYEWTHTEVVAKDPLLQAKAPWLNIPFFAIRTVVYISLWAFTTWLLVSTSRRQDENGSLELTKKNSRNAAIFIVVFALTFWIASMDWIMSIEPHWFSTIFGVYNFTGLLLTGLAAITILLIALRRTGVLQNIVRDDHLHDLGKLMFAFSTFWMYIWFSQYMLIWYSNIPEETIYFIRREENGWATFTILNVVFNWVIPFVFLISRSAKRNEGLLLKVSIVILVGHWIDLFWMILPSFMPNGPTVGLWELVPLLAALALFLFVTLRALGSANIVATKDPMLVESLHYHSS